MSLARGDEAIGLLVIELGLDGIWLGLVVDKFWLEAELGLDTRLCLNAPFFALYRIVSSNLLTTWYAMVKAENDMDKAAIVVKPSSFAKVTIKMSCGISSRKIRIPVTA